MIERSTGENPALSVAPRGGILPHACADCWRRPEAGAKAPPSCLDATFWPVVVMTTVGNNSDAATRCRIDQLSALMQGEIRFVLVIDSKELKSRNRNPLLTNWLNENQERVQRHCAGIALVMRGVVTRFIVGSLMLLIRQPITYKVFEETEPAIAWAKQQVARETTF
jgi:hypothetical protein